MMRALAQRRPRLLLIDNHDSYTHNLAHLLAAASGSLPVVVACDAYPTLAACLRAHGTFDGYVISPGPGTPHNSADFRPLAAEALAQRRIPVLGVCLGHQALCAQYGARVQRSADGPAHGIVAKVERTAVSDLCALWRGVPRSFLATRYHSLAVVPESLPLDALVADAWAGDILMAVHHTRYPLFGVQFHPESVASEHGKAIAANFYNIVSKLRRGRAKPWQPIREPACFDTVQLWQDQEPPCINNLEVMYKRLRGVAADTPAIFHKLYRNSVPSFWLDSADAGAGRGRFSLMGDATGPLSEVVTYDVAERAVRITSRGKSRLRRGMNIFDYLDEQLARRRIESPDDLPLDMNGGYVGYLGYELKEDCGAGPNTHTSGLPDSQLIFADRAVLIDHTQDAVYLLVVHERAQSSAALAWIRNVGEALSRNAQPLQCEPAMKTTPPRFTLESGRSEYLDDIGRVLDALDAGDSYEVCLTNRLRTTFHTAPDPLAVYLTLRAVNPAPYGAYLRLDEDVAVCSSSPERFLRISGGLVESKPIKGTRARGGTPQEDAQLQASLAGSAKDRSENLMIVDLVRNDLSRVCVPNSVHVPMLMKVESYAHVHQLVSAVRGELSRGRSAVDSVRAAFPMGSMTGAPKQRTMHIIDQLEHSARGVYSGAIGYFSLSGAADLSVAIRTAVIHGGTCEIGVGGAVVALSNPDEEFDEIITKGRALMAAVARTVTGRDKVVLEVEVQRGRSTKYS